MRRLVVIPIPYVAAAVLALVLAGGIFALRQSQRTKVANSGAVVSPGSSATTASTPASPTGNPEGLALLARSREAYARVPAVLITGALGPESVRFTGILERGKVVAEAFKGLEGHQLTELVAPHGSPTLARDPGGSCWRQLAKANPQSLTDIGEVFPSVPSGAVVQAPGRTAHGWLMTIEANGHTSTFAVDASTYLVGGITAGASGRNVTEHVDALGATPKLPLPEPRC